MAAYGVIVAEEVTFKVMIDGDLKTRLDQALADRKLSLTAFTAGIVQTFLDQDPLVQSMLAGQIPADDDLVEAALRRISHAGKRMKVAAKRMDGK